MTAIIDTSMETITLEEFEQMRPRGANARGVASPERLIIRNMRPNTAIILEHRSKPCVRVTARKCWLQQAAGHEATLRGLSAKTYHKEDGRLAVALVRKE